MKLVKLTQNTPEWLEFRYSHIGASDAMAIMGTSPWKSAHDLYEEKRSKLEQGDNFAKSEGRRLEPLALEAFEQQTGHTMFPMVFTHDKYDWMSASFDGITLDRKTILEIKCPGKVDHLEALCGKIPPKYYPQIQHQLEVSGLDRAHYFSYAHGSGIVVVVERDQDYINILVEKELEFWDCLTKAYPPPNKKFNYRKAMTHRL